MRSQHIFGCVTSLGAVGHAELPGDDLNFRELLRDCVLEALFALHSGCAAGRVHQKSDLSLASH
jgi:hypothetical protein